MQTHWGDAMVWTHGMSTDFLMGRAAGGAVISISKQDQRDTKRLKP